MIQEILKKIAGGSDSRVDKELDKLSSDESTNNNLTKPKSNSDAINALVDMTNKVDKVNLPDGKVFLELHKKLLGDLPDDTIVKVVTPQQKNISSAKRIARLETFAVQQYKFNRSVSKSLLEVGNRLSEQRAKAIDDMKADENERKVEKSKLLSLFSSIGGVAGTGFKKAKNSKLLKALGLGAIAYGMNKYEKWTDFFEKLPDADTTIKTGQDIATAYSTIKGAQAGKAVVGGIEKTVTGIKNIKEKIKPTPKTTALPTSTKIAEVSKKVSPKYAKIMGAIKTAQNAIIKLGHWARKGVKLIQKLIDKLPPSIGKLFGKVGKFIFKYGLIIDILVNIGGNVTKYYGYQSITQEEFHRRNKEDINRIISIIGFPWLFGLLAGLTGPAAIVFVPSAVVLGIWKGEEIYNAIGGDIVVNALYDYFINNKTTSFSDITGQLKDRWFDEISKLGRDVVQSIFGNKIQSKSYLKDKYGNLTPAEYLHKAMEGVGTDEDAIMTVLNYYGKSQSEMSKIKAEYKKKYGVSLSKDLSSELSADDWAKVMPTIAGVKDIQGNLFIENTDNFKNIKKIQSSSEYKRYEDDLKLIKEDAEKAKIELAKRGRTFTIKDGVIEIVEDRELNYIQNLEKKLRESTTNEDKVDIAKQIAQYWKSSVEERKKLDETKTISKETYGVKSSVVGANAYEYEMSMKSSYTGKYNSNPAGESVSDDLVNLTKGFEKFSPNAFWDVKQYSIGYGTKANSPTETITEPEAFSRMKSRLQMDYDYVVQFGKTHGYNWNQSQAEALTSFMYNTGKGNFLKLTQNGNRTNEKIQEMMLKYVYADGKVLGGLVKRRQKESALFSGKDVSIESSSPYTKNSGDGMPKVSTNSQSNSIPTTPSIKPKTTSPMNTGKGRSLTNTLDNSMFSTVSPMGVHDYWGEIPV